MIYLLSIDVLSFFFMSALAFIAGLHLDDKEYRGAYSFQYHTTYIDALSFSITGFIYEIHFFYQDDWLAIKTATPSVPMPI